MKRIKHVFVGLALVLISVMAFAGAEKGNGQLIVKDSEGKILPFEEFVSSRSKSYMGYHFLPRTNNFSSPFERDYITEFDLWLDYLAGYSEYFAKGLKETIEKTDFVFLDSDITFKIEDYPVGQDLSVDYFKAAGYFNSHIYLSIPQMDRYTDSERYTAEQLRAFTIVHELLHPYSRGYSTAAKLSLGRLILDSRVNQMSKLNFHIQAAKLGYQFWLHENIDFRIEFVENLKRLNRMRYVEGRVSSAKYDIEELKKLSRILKLPLRKMAISRILPTYKSLKAVLKDLNSSLEAGTELEQETAFRFFSNVTEGDFLFWLESKVFVAAPRDSEGKPEFEPTVDNYLVNYNSVEYFAVQQGYSFLVPIQANYKIINSLNELRIRLRQVEESIERAINLDKEDVLLSTLITPYLIQHAQKFLMAWEPKDLCSRESLEELKGVNPFWLIYEYVDDSTWSLDGTDYSGSTVSYSKHQIWYFQRVNEKLYEIVSKVAKIKECMSDKQHRGLESMQAALKNINESNTSSKEKLKEIYHLKHLVAQVKYFEEKTFQDAFVLLKGEIETHCKERGLKKTCRKLNKKYGY